LTVTLTRETGVLLKEPVEMNGLNDPSKKKATLGITEQSIIREFIQLWDYYLDVDSSHPWAIYGSKGMTVRHLKGYVSWVQNVAIQFGSYLLI
jgi:hypothetical protein